MKPIINEYIVHKSFGRGLVTKEGKGKITVEFTGQVGDKIFQYPDALEKFLSFEDISLQEESLLMLQTKRQIHQEEERVRLEQKRMEEERLLKELEQKKKNKKTSRTKATGTVRKTVNNLLK